MAKTSGEGKWYYIRMSSVWFALDREQAGRQLLKDNRQLQKIESDMLNSVIGSVGAQFLEQFGFEGVFEVVGYDGATRSSVRLRAADGRTNATLMAHPGWMDHFLTNIVV